MDMETRPSRSGNPGRPGPDEAAPYYFRYIDQVAGEDIVPILGGQLRDVLRRLEDVSDARSAHRYAPGKWSIREVLGHVTDSERLFVSRALMFARGFPEPLPSFDPDTSALAARDHELPWADLVDDFRCTRLATLSFFRNLTPEAWPRRGVASGYEFTVRALAFIVAGHAAHHAAILAEKYR